MDLLYAIVGGLGLGFIINKILARVRKDPQLPKIDTKSNNSEKNISEFAKSVGKGKLCPPHSWQSTSKDMHGLKCSACNQTYP